MTTARTSYGWTSIALHWIGAAALIASFITGNALEEATREARREIYANHLFWATLLAVPLLARVIWRLRDGFKTTSVQHPALNFLSKAVMVGFLICISGAVLTGLILPWSGGLALVVGLISIPSPVAAMPEVHKSLEGIHGLLSHLWIPLLILHLAGVAKHVLARDGVLKGMIHPRSEGV